MRPFLLCLLISVGAVACGSSTGPAASATSRPSAGQPVRSATKAPQPVASLTAPLTGLPWVGDPRAAARGAVAVVLRSAGAPGADVVWQQVDGSEGLRSIAVFQSGEPATESPVADLQASDLSALAALHAAVVYAFAYPAVSDGLPAAGVVGVSPASRPVGDFVSTATGTSVDVGRVTQDLTLPPVPAGVFGYAQAGQQLASTGGTPSSGLVLAMPGDAVQDWRYDALAHRWTTATAPGAAVANVIVQDVPYRPTTRHHPDGSIIMAPRLLGRGSCTAFANGSTAPCSWVKGDDNAFPVFSDVSGVPLRLLPGPTWIILAPDGTTVRSTP